LEEGRLAVGRGVASGALRTGRRILGFQPVVCVLPVKWPASDVTALGPVGGVEHLSGWSAVDTGDDSFIVRLLFLVIT